MRAQGGKAVARQLGPHGQRGVELRRELLGPGELLQLRPVDVDEVERDRADTGEAPGLGHDLVAEQVRRHLVEDVGDAERRRAVGQLPCGAQRVLLVGVGVGPRLRTGGGDQTVSRAEVPVHGHSGHPGRRRDHLDAGLGIVAQEPACGPRDAPHVLDRVGSRRVARLAVARAHVAAVAHLRHDVALKGRARHFDV